ncbi:energy transducer TonB [Rhizobiaceae bacterium BDR2-2]|uniref:Energy transducer TonB n=1 Tax=Ectorhizobium quercum TaxID=2965071 RepID=A0AAE3SU11_9HYPH|nr:energy transducer TonB [Ectorhizobium quercum]MCX8995574.1 energy transducer TonB [Ectorhizobium quercum]
MIPSCPHEPRSSRLRDTLLWGSAALVMLSAHVSSAAWLLSREPEVIADSGSPPAILIEMAAEPEAVNTETTQVSEDMHEAQDVASLTPPEEQPVEEAELEPPPPPEPEPVVEPEPVEDVTETLPEPDPEPTPIEQEVAKLMENVEVPLPVARPQPPKPEVKKVQEKPKRVEARKEEPRERPRPRPQASKGAVAAAAEVNRGTRNASARSSTGASSSSVSPARWQSRVQAHLARRKNQLVKTRDKSTQGTVYVRFNIDTSGNVLSVALSRSSGHPSLDQEVLALVQRASPVPAPPPDVSRTLTIPFEFTTR